VSRSERKRNHRWPFLPFSRFIWGGVNGRTDNYFRDFKSCESRENLIYCPCCSTRFDGSDCPTESIKEIWENYQRILALIDPFPHDVSKTLGQLRDMPNSPYCTVSERDEWNDVNAALVGA